MAERTNTFPVDATDVKIRKQTKHLQKIFDSTKDNKDKAEIALTHRICKEIFVNELNVKYETLSYLMRYALPEGLCYYMRTWKGWRENLKFKEFKDYLNWKIGFIIAHQKQFCRPAERLEDVKLGVPYVLDIFESPRDVFLTESNPETWVLLNVDEFLNLPSCGVTVTLPFVKFARFFTFKKQQINPKKDSQFASTHFNFNRNKHQNSSNPSYDLKLIRKYFEDLRTLIGQLRNDRKIEVLSELDAICVEFIESLNQVVDYAEIKFIQLPFTGGYNIGQHMYLCRTQCDEMMVPRVCLTISDFTKTQKKSDSEFSFDDLLNENVSEESKKDLMGLLNDSITYNCRICNKDFGGHKGFLEMTLHLRRKHILPSEYVCSKCYRKSGACELLGLRWRHCCQKD